MTDLWYPGGVPDPAPDGAWGRFTDFGEPKFLLHTTEGHLAVYHPDPNTGAGRRYYGNAGTWPNYTLAWHAGSGGWRIYNHIPAHRSSLSLRNRPGGVQTNRDNVTQVEIATRAAEIRVLPEEALAELAALLAWEHVTRDVPLASTVRWVAYPASYGERASQRLSGPDWDNYAGVLGHQHAPENDHGDPGAFPVERLLALAREHLAPPRPPEGDVDLTLTPEQLRAIGTEAAAAWHALVWGQMQAPPDNAPPGWHPPYQRDVGSLVRRGYEMTGAMWADLADLRAAVDAHAGPVARSRPARAFIDPGTAGRGVRGRGDRRAGGARGAGLRPAGAAPHPTRRGGPGMNWVRSNPVAVMDLVKAVLAVGAASGVFVLDDRLSQAIIALVWGLVTFAATVSTRARVTPWPPRSRLDQNR